MNLSFAKKIRKPSVGIQISDASIKIVVLDSEGTSIINKIKTSLPAGVVVHGRINDKTRLSQILSACLHDHEIDASKSRISFCLPDNLVYSKSVLLAPDHRSSDKDDIRNELQSSIPVNFNNYDFIYKPVNRKNEPQDDDRKRYATFSIARKSLEEWRDFFKANGLAVNDFSLESTAAYRAIFPEPLAENNVIIDLAEDWVRTYFYIGEYPVETSIYFAALNIDSVSGDDQQKSDGFFVDFNSELDIFEKKYGPVRKLSIIGDKAAQGNISPLIKTKTGKETGLGLAFLDHSHELLPYIVAIGAAQNAMIDFPELTFASTPKNSRASIMSFSKKINWRKYKNTLLLSVLLLALIGGLAVFWRQSNKKAIPTVQKPIEKNISVNFSIDIATTTQALGIFIPGRIEKSVIKEPQEISTAVESARKIIAAKISKDEYLSDKPINLPTKTNDVIFPLTLEWLAVSQPAASNVILKLANDNSSTTYQLISSAITSIAPGPVKFYQAWLSCQFEPELSENRINQIEAALKNKSSSSAKNAASVRSVSLKGSIKKANLRSGPGSEYPVIGSTGPGSTYELVDDQGEWYKIKDAQGKVFWLNKSLAQLATK